MQPFVINRRTDFRNVDLVDDKNNYHESIFVGKARDMAVESGLDLVCFKSPEKGKLALCKIVDYGKWLYRQKKIQKQESNVNKHIVKEIRFSPVISDHDIEHKVKQVGEFLSDGDEVLLTMRFKGIHNRHKEVGLEKMNQIVSMCLVHGEEVHRKSVDNQIVVRLKKNKIKE